MTSVTDRLNAALAGRYGIRLWSAVLVAASVSACESPLSPHDRDALRVAEALWAGRGFEEYGFEIRRECFCPPLLTDWARVEVKGENVTSVVLLSTGEEVLPPARDMFPTVNQVFATIRTTASSDWVDRIEVAFDSVNGFPTAVNFVSKPNIADAGGAYYLRNLVPRPAH